MDAHVSLEALEKFKHLLTEFSKSMSVEAQKMQLHLKKTHDQLQQKHFELKKQLQMCQDPVSYEQARRQLAEFERLFAGFCQAAQECIKGFQQQELMATNRGKAVVTIDRKVGVLREYLGARAISIETHLFRKTANTGLFKHLEEPMQLRNVKKVAQEAGIGLEGIKIKIVRDPELIGKGLCGYASPDGEIIQLYPDAFTDTESLIKTLGHERMHVYQTKVLGPAKDTDTLHLYEKGAWDSESSWWMYYNKGGK